AALPGRLGDQAEEVARRARLGDRAVGDVARAPRAALERGAHEVVGHAYRVVGVLEEDRAVGGPVERGVVAGGDERPRLALLLRLAADEVDDVGVVGVEHDHLGRAPGLAARLDHPGRGVGRAHEGHRPRSRAPAAQPLPGRAQAREVHARARAPFENDPLLAIPVEDRVHGVVDGEDEAGRALRLRLDPHVEPDRAVEGGLLVEEEMGQLVAERRPIARRGEVALRLAPRADRAHHAADQLPYAALALGRAERAAEVLRDDDVGRELRPGLRHLDVALLEDGLAALAGDDRRADLPLDRLVRIGARRDEAPRDRQAAPRRALRRTRPSALLPSNRLRRHAQPPPGSAPYLAVPGL